MKNKLKWYLKSGILYFGIPFLLWNCEGENIDSPEGQQSNIETVAVNEAVDFFNVKMAADTAKPGGETYVTPHLDHIAQEEISNSDALLTIIPATTIYSAHYSRILLLKIDDEIQSLVFSMYPSDGSTHEQFSGEIIITDIAGNFLNGYRVVNGIFVSQLRKTATPGKTAVAAKNNNVVCPDHGECTEDSTCVLCLQELEEVVVIGNLGNNGGPTPFADLNDFPGIDEGGGGGPDMGMGWDYGPGEGGSPGNNGGNDDQITIDDSVTPCVENIINQLQEKDNHISVVPDISVTDSISHISQIILDLFSASQQYHINFEIGEVGPGANATTLPTGNNPEPGQFTFIITLDEEYVNNATTLAIARTIIHESIHVYLSYIGQADATSSFVQLLNNYRENYSTDDNEGLGEHEFMTQFIEAMGHSLAAWDNYSLPQDYYNSLAWSGGMLQTEAFGLLSAQDQQAAIDANIAEGQADAPATVDAQGTNCN